jgi:hypothetical protein
MTLLILHQSCNFLLPTTSDLTTTHSAKAERKADNLRQGIFKRTSHKSSSLTNIYEELVDENCRFAYFKIQK